MRLIANVIRISRAKLHCNRLLASQDKSHFFGTRCRGRVKISHKPQYMNTVTLLTNGRWLFATVFDYAPSVRPLQCRRNQSWAVSHDNEILRRCESEVIIKIYSLSSLSFKRCNEKIWWARRVAMRFIPVVGMAGTSTRWVVFYSWFSKYARTLVVDLRRVMHSRSWHYVIGGCTTVSK